MKSACMSVPYCEPDPAGYHSTACCSAFAKIIRNIGGEDRPFAENPVTTTACFALFGCRVRSEDERVVAVRRRRVAADCDADRRTRSGAIRREYPMCRVRPPEPSARGMTATAGARSAEQVRPRRQARRREGMSRRSSRTGVPQRRRSDHRDRSPRRAGQRPAGGGRDLSDAAGRARRPGTAGRRLGERAVHAATTCRSN